MIITEVVGRAICCAAGLVLSESVTALLSGIKPEQLTGNDLSLLIKKSDRLIEKCAEQLTFTVIPGSVTITLKIDSRQGRVNVVFLRNGQAMITRMSIEPFGKMIIEDYAPPGGRDRPANGALLESLMPVVPFIEAFARTFRAELPTNLRIAADYYLAQQNEDPEAKGQARQQWDTALLLQNRQHPVAVHLPTGVR